MPKYALGGWYRFLFKASLGLILAFGMFISLVKIIGRNGYIGGELLVYSLNSFGALRVLMLFDEYHNLTLPIITYDRVSSYSLSVDGHLAYSAMPGGNSEIYVLDVLSADSSPINITHTTTKNEYSVVWSPDGRFLAFDSYQYDDNRQIYVWDGKTIINITPDDLENRVSAYQMSWGFDGQLAFTVQYDDLSSDAAEPSEIFIWDGIITTNLSQNPTGDDQAPVWNAAGRLAFLSEHGDEYDIFVWDGVSVENGSPDFDTFANVSPELTSSASFPTWTNSRYLAFEALSPQGAYMQIYIWDGQTTTNISHNPMQNNGVARWSADGRYAYMTLFSSPQFLYIRDANNQTLLTVEGQDIPAWSLDGRLIFCAPDSDGWILSLWNRPHLTEIVRGYDIRAQWQNGAEVHCSSG